MKHSLYQAVNWLWKQHFPRLCLLCEQVITSASPDHLCPYCRLALPFNVRACSRCAIPLSPHATLTGNAIGFAEPATCCGQCMTKPMADNAVAPLIHRDGAAHLIHRLKFHQGEPEGRALAHILLTHIRSSIHSACRKSWYPFPWRTGQPLNAVSIRAGCWPTTWVENSICR